MTLPFIKTDRSILIALSETEGKIAYFQLLLSHVTFLDISIMFFTKARDGRKQYQALRQNDFAFNLELELTKLLNENLDQLREQRDELKLQLKKLK